MKRKLSIFIITFLILQNLSYADNGGVEFKDINNSVFKNSILKAQSKGIINGYSDGTFKPNNGVTFIESLAILIKSGTFANSIWEYKGENDAHWSDSYKKLYNDKFLSKELKFSDNQNITRDFAVYLMLRQIGVEFESGDFHKIDNKFKDISSYSTFSAYIAFAGKVGISNGYEDGTFGPKKSVSRGELTAMSLKTLVDNKDYILSEYSKIKGGNSDIIKEEVVEDVSINGNYTDESWEKVSKLNSLSEVIEYINYIPSEKALKGLLTKLDAKKTDGLAYEAARDSGLKQRIRDGMNPGVPRFLYPEASSETIKSVYSVPSTTLSQITKDMKTDVRYTGGGFFPDELKLEDIRKLTKDELDNYTYREQSWYLENGSATSKFIENSWIKDSVYTKYYVQSEILGQSLKTHNQTNLGYTSNVLDSFSFWNGSQGRVYPTSFKEAVQKKFNLSVREFEGKVLEEIIEHGKSLGLDSKYLVAGGDHLDPEYTVRYPYSQGLSTASQGFDEKGIGLFRGTLNDSVGEKEFKLRENYKIFNMDAGYIGEILLISDYLK